MTPKDANTCADFWKQVRSLTELVHTRGAEGLVECLMEEFPHLPPSESQLLQKQLTTLVNMLPFLKQANATKVAAVDPTRKIPYRD